MPSDHHQPNLLKNQQGFLLGFLSLCLLMLAGVAVIIGYGVHSYFNKGPLEQSKTLVIEQGMGVSAIADVLEKEKVINQALLFKIASRLDKDKRFLKAGEYQFTANAPMTAIMKQLKEGDVVNRTITIREGLTSYQVVQLLNNNGALSGKITTIPPEGSLLPETYQFTNGDDRAEKIERMQRAMNEVIDALWESRDKNLPFKTKKEAIILASIVEKETGVGLERAKVAGVFVNRLRINMPLQTDPTVIYALTKGKIEDNGKGPLGRRLLRKDLKVDDPYNTYKNAGLPPGPIANPGKAAIEAVLNPASHDYLYFVADGTGGHAFGKNLAQHNENVRKWRKIRANQ